MKVSYFPGCTLKNKAVQLDLYGRACAEKLGFELEEIDSWQCCGGTFTTANDEIATKLSSVRALMEAEKKGQPLVSLCSACHNVLKQTNYQVQQGGDFAFRLNNYIAPEHYDGGAKVMHYLEFLRDEIGYDKIKEQVKIEVDSIFKDKSVVLTGTLENMSRDEATKYLEMLGANVVSSVSKNTDYVLCGQNAGSKLNKAKTRGIQIVDLDFLKQELDKISNLL